MAVSKKGKKWIASLDKTEFAIARALFGFAQRVRNERNQDDIVDEAKKALAEITKQFEVSK